MMPLPEVSVIIPTLGLHERRDCLRRAIDSVLDQRGVVPHVIVVVNGSSYDAAFVQDLASRATIELLHQSDADLPGALRLGRSAVRTPWFASLDDDDLLLPEALATRFAALVSNPECDVVVTNGYSRDTHGDRLHAPDMRSVARDPLGALTQGNWLLPGSWLCRNSRATWELFDRMPRYLECTYLALRFSTVLRPLFLDQPTVVWCTDTPASLSKSRAFRLGQEPALRRLLEMELPANVRKCFRNRLGIACHESASALLAEGHWASAWRLHLASLVEPNGWRRLHFTWKLALTQLRGAAEVP